MEVDVALLIPAEAEEYSRLRKALDSLPENYDGTSWQQPKRVVIYMLTFFTLNIGAICLCFWWAFAASTPGATGGYRLAPLPLVLMFIILGVIVVYPWAWIVRDNNRIRARRQDATKAIEEFLTGINYVRRVKGPRDRDYGTSDWQSTRQRQHAWYREHSELNWRHREQGEMLGFDNADKYVNNFLESER